MEKETKSNRNSTNWVWLVFYSKLSRQGQNKEANYFVGYKGKTFGLREREREGAAELLLCLLLVVA